MFRSKFDSDLVGSEEMMILYDMYKKKFGEDAPGFNYEQYQTEGDKHASEVYRDAIIEALQKGRPVPPRKSILMYECFPSEPEREKMIAEYFDLRAEYRKAFKQNFLSFHSERYPMKEKEDRYHFSMEIMREALRRGEPYPRHDEAAGEAFDRAVLERLRREGKIE